MSSRRLFNPCLPAILAAALLCALLPQGRAQSIEELEKLARRSRNYNEQYKLGMLYFNGDVPDKDTEDAVSMFKKAARENVDAQLMLGFCYAMGEGTKRDEKEAAEWYEKAAIQGSHAAMYRLAACYEKGLGVDKDPGAAYRWYRRLADETDLPEADFKVAAAYYTGGGINKDYAAAAKWFRKGAEKGHSLCQMYLGDCYRLGQGGPRDNAEAYKWLYLAAELGNEAAVKRRDRLETVYKISASDKAEGLKRAEQFQTASN